MFVLNHERLMEEGNKYVREIYFPLLLPLPAFVLLLFLVLHVDRAFDSLVQPVEAAVIINLDAQTLPLT